MATKHNIFIKKLEKKMKDCHQQASMVSGFNKLAHDNDKRDD
jgi:hypothetical protein